MMSAKARKRRSELAVATQWGDPEMVASARRDYWAARGQDIIRDLIAKSPPLSSTQIDQLVKLLSSMPACDA